MSEVLSQQEIDALLNAMGTIGCVNDDEWENKRLLKFESELREKINEEV